MLGDLHYALRTLLKTPRFAITAIFVLALGIGANSAIFTVVYSVLLRPLPYQDPSRVAVILGSSERHGGTMPLTPGDYLDYRDQTRSFNDMTAASVWGPTLTGTDRAEKLDGLRATVSLFRMLGVSAAYGRLFSDEDAGADAPDVVVLSHDVFERRFGGDPAIVGRTLILDGKAHTVIGVTTRGFYFPPFWALKADVYVPVAIRSGEGGSRGPGYLRVFGRLKPGVSMEQAGAEVRTIASRLAAAYPRTNAGLTATVTPIHEMAVGSIRPVLLVLLGAVVCTLLIACANIANLLIARASGRRKEIAIRQSLGAERFHLMRQFLAESIVLAAAGGALGLALAWWAVPLFVAGIPEFGMFRLPRQSEIEPGGAVMMFNFAVCLATALVCGFVTAWHANGTDLNGDLKESGRGQVATRSGRRLRNVLATAEVAIALLLLTGAGLLVESYRNLLNVDPGFDAGGVIAVNVGLAASGHAQPDARASFYQQALDQFRTLPGVTAASAVNHVPLAGDRFGTRLTVEGKPQPGPGQMPGAVYRVAMPGYFDVMRMRLIEGRDFTDRDNETAPGVVIINATAARSLWPGENPVGRRLREGDAESHQPWRTVIGVIADVKQSDWKVAADSEIYIPFAQDALYRHDPASFATMTLVLRAKEPAVLGGAIRQRIAGIDRNISVPNVLMMDQVIRDVLWQPRASMAFVLTFAGIAMLLASVGIYAVVSFITAARTQEIGIRMALGARRMDVLRMVVGQSLPPVAAGVGVGLVAALALTRLMSSMLFGVRPADPLVFAAVAVGLSVIALAAAAIPARKASRLDPLIALRHE